MPSVLPKFGKKERRRFDKHFKETHEIVISHAKNIINENLNIDGNLQRAICRAITCQDPSDYPYIFRLSYEYNGRSFMNIANIAAAIHLLQVSTFITDDIFDNALKREGKKTIVYSHGINFAIICAEIMQNISILTIINEIKLKNLPNGYHVLKLLCRTLNNIYIGQYLDISNTGKYHTTPSRYYKTISMTTAGLLADISESGALLANVAPNRMNKLVRFSYFYGMALQICDDIIDILYNSSLTGKSYALDLKGHRMRLPYILASKLSSSKDKQRLITFMKHRKSKWTDIKKIVFIIKKSGAIDKCKVIAKKYILKALNQLTTLRNGSTKESLYIFAVTLLEDMEVK